MYMIWNIFWILESIFEIISETIQIINYKKASANSDANEVANERRLNYTSTLKII